MKKTKNTSLIAMSCICVLSLILLLCVTAYGKKEVHLPFEPPPFDENAVVGVPEVPAELFWRKQVIGEYTVSLCGKPTIAGQAMDVWLTNPLESDVWMKVRILDIEGNILGETGLIRPGEYVRSVFLQTVPAVGSDIEMKIMIYERDTYYSAGAASFYTTVD